MSDATRPYIIHSEAECERLERQAMLGGIEDHLRYIPAITGAARILDLGCGPGTVPWNLEPPQVREVLAEEEPQPV